MSDTIRTNMAEMSYKDLQNELIEALKERNDLAAQLTEALKPKACRAKPMTMKGWLVHECGNESPTWATAESRTFCGKCGGRIEVCDE